MLVIMKDYAPYNCLFIYLDINFNMEELKAHSHFSSLKKTYKIILTKYEIVFYSNSCMPREIQSINASKVSSFNMESNCACACLSMFWRVAINYTNLFQTTKFALNIAYS